MADASASVHRSLDFSSACAQGISSGASLNLQFGYRDGMAMMSGFNLTDAVGIEFD